MYLVKTPWWLRQLYSTLTWQIPVQEKKLFLTFDDGPHELATPFVLDELKKYNARATFFCIGKNVVQHPGIYNQILSDGHMVGNHTNNHVNGWKTNDEEYLQNIETAHQVFKSELFRPPYGRIKKSQARLVQKRYKVVMWDVLSGDFDVRLPADKCLQNVVKHSTKGSIIVFHDSQKAFEKLAYILPKVLKHFTDLGYTFSVIPTSGDTAGSR